MVIAIQTDGRSTRNIRLAWLLVISLAAVDLIWAPYARLTFQGFASVASVIAIPLVFGLYCEYRSKRSCFRDFGCYLSLWFAFPFVVNSFSYLAATARRPLYDSLLSALDHVAGFHWMHWFELIHSRPMVGSLLGLVYSSMFLQIVCSIAIFALANATDRNDELIWLAMLAALQAVVVSGFLPALGPMAGPIPHWTETLLKLRQGAVTAVSLKSEAGIVTFPSIHTAFALIFIYVHRPPSWTFGPFLAVNALMLVATPFVGHHYLMDMVGGGVTVLMALALYRLVIQPATERARPALHAGFAESALRSGS